MNKISITELIKDNYCYFSFYRSNHLYYIISLKEKTYRFSIPIEDIGNGTIENKMKAIYLMRWIRKAIENSELIENF